MGIGSENMMTGLMYAGYTQQALGQVGAGTAATRQEKYSADVHKQLAELKRMQAAIVGAEMEGATRAAFSKAGVSGVSVDLVLEQNAKRAALNTLYAGYQDEVSAWEAKNRARAQKYATIQAVSSTIIGAAGAAYSLFPTGTGTSQGFGQTLVQNWGGTSPQVNPLGSADYSGYA